jgi:hypothetical protein
MIVVDVNEDTAPKLFEECRTAGGPQGIPLDHVLNALHLNLAHALIKGVDHFYER